MKDFLIERGWTFTGTCGCTPKMDSYVNPSYPGWEFAVGTAHFNLKQQNGVGIKRTVSSGTQATISLIYEQHFK